MAILIFGCTNNELACEVLALYYLVHSYVNHLHPQMRPHLTGAQQRAG